MAGFAFSDHPIQDLIRKNLDTAGVFVRAARNQSRSSAANVAAAKAREALERALQLVRALDDSEQEPWQAELLSLQRAVHALEEPPARDSTSDP